MKTYDAYKESDILGVNKVPKDWKVVNFRYLIDVLTDFTANGSFGDLAKNVNYLEEGVSRLVRLTDLRADFKNKGIYLNEASHNYLKKSELFGGEILLANVGAYAGLAWIYEGIEGKASLGPNMFLLKFKDVLDKRFAYISLTSFYLHSQLLDKATSSAQPKLNKEDVKSCVFILPTLKEQTQIANYLDHKTAIIDALIEKKELLIQKLQAQRQAIINEAVTKGLNPNAKMKDSGIEWLGEIPKHWAAKRLKFIFKIQKRIAGELGYDILSVTQRGLKVKDISNYKGQFSMDYSKYQIVNEGDFVMNHMDLLTGYIDISKQTGVTSPDYRVFELIEEKCNPQYFLYISQLCYKEKIFYSHGQGVSQLGRWRLQAKEFNNMTFPFPSFEEQKEIADYISLNTKIMDKVLVETEKSIKKLKAYRQSIISEAVTGKIDVRDWQQKKIN
ncbi:restriction endonuclease subunit S [Bizionia hallyeonensis]|uniref:Restriction endonuclease subunit S n=1 Tax=Bizionia hallyeonensis TaxID=1123757 RepID=A0ABW0C1V9_9FLAO